MNLYKYKSFNGKGYITIQSRYNNGTIHYGKATDLFISQIRIPFTKYAIAFRKSGVSEFSKYGIERIKRIFGEYNYKVDGLKVIRANKSKDSQNDIFYILDHIWILNPKYDFSCCKNKQVMFSRTIHKYAGYSHRGFALFGIGDMLFDENNDNEKYYYRNKSLRIKFIKTLIKYINDPHEFEFVVQSGITHITPFIKRGSKIIDNMHEAYQAASNFAKYLS